MVEVAVRRCTGYHLRHDLRQTAFLFQVKRWRSFGGTAQRTDVAKVYAAVAVQVCEDVDGTAAVLFQNLSMSNRYHCIAIDAGKKAQEHGDDAIPSKQDIREAFQSNGLLAAWTPYSLNCPNLFNKTIDTHVLAAPLKKCPLPF